MNEYYTPFPRTGFVSVGTTGSLGQIILLWGPVLRKGGCSAVYSTLHASLCQQDLLLPLLLLEEVIKKMWPLVDPSVRLGQPCIFCRFYFLSMVALLSGVLLFGILTFKVIKSWLWILAFSIIECLWCFYVWVLQFFYKNVTILADFVFLICSFSSYNFNLLNHCMLGVPFT